MILVCTPANELSSKYVDQSELEILLKKAGMFFK